MSVRKFLLPVASTASSQSALQVGLLLARMWNAHLEVLYIQPDGSEIAPLAGEGLSSTLIESMMATNAKEDKARLQTLRDLFAAAAEEAAIPVGAAHCGTNEPSTSFVVTQGREEQLIAHKARLADLTIVPHPLAGEDVATAEALHAVLFDSGRPVLLAPVHPPASIGRRIAIAWNGTAYAASALASAMPFVRRAESVQVLASEEYSRSGPNAEAVQDYIAQHGVSASIQRFNATKSNVGAGLLEAAGSFGADMMVMGAYSTASRLRQLILGGVTRHVLQYAEICVLMNR